MMLNGLDHSGAEKLMHKIWMSHGQQQPGQRSEHEQKKGDADQAQVAAKNPGILIQIEMDDPRAPRFLSGIDGIVSAGEQ